MAGSVYLCRKDNAENMESRHPAGGEKTLTIIARNLSCENKYVKSVTFNGKTLDKTIEHADLMAGGELVFEMTAK